MATPFQIGCQTALRSVSNPTDSWAVLYCRFAAKSDSPYGTKATRHTVQQKGTQHQTNLSRTRTKRFARCAKSKERSKRQSRKGCRPRKLRASRQEPRPESQ